MKDIKQKIHAKAVELDQHYEDSTADQDFIWHLERMGEFGVSLMQEELDSLRKQIEEKDKEIEEIRKIKHEIGDTARALDDECLCLKEEIEGLKLEIIKLGDMNVHLGKILLTPNERETIQSLKEENERLRAWQDVVRQLKVGAELDGMMKSSMELYEKILDTPGFSFHFNNICNIALLKTKQP